MTRSAGKSTLAGGLLLAATSAAARADSFTLIAPLGTSGNTDAYSRAQAISGTGVVVGYSTTPTTGTADAPHAFTYAAATRTLTDLGGDPNTTPATSYAYGINAAGVVVGDSVDQSKQFLAVAKTYTTATGFQSVAASASGQTASRLNAINNTGTFVGGGQDSNLANVPVYGQYGGSSITVLPGIAGATTEGNVASSINSSGLIAGNAAYDPYGGMQHLFTYNSAAATPAAALTDLGTPANVNRPGGFTSVNSQTSINDAGVIAGSARELAPTASFSQHDQAFTDANGTFTLLQSLSSSTIANAQAFGINNQGVVVGTSDTADGSATHAVLWLAGSTTAVDLNTYFAKIDPTDAAKYVLTSAVAINDSDLIVGTVDDGTNPNTGDAVNDGSYVLDLSTALAPTPEPTSLALVAPSALVVLRRRRRA